MQARPYSAAVRERDDLLNRQIASIDNLTKGKYMDDGEQLLLAAQRLGANAPKTKFVYRQPKELKTAEEKHMHDLVNSSKFVEQREMIKKLAKINKGRTDTSEPKWHFRKEALKGNGRKRTDHYLQVEHQRELKSLKQRLQSVGSWNSRKKNGTDPLANPVWFFHGKNRNYEDEKKMRLDGFE